MIRIEDQDDSRGIYPHPAALCTALCRIIEDFSQLRPYKVSGAVTLSLPSSELGPGRFVPRVVTYPNFLDMSYPLIKIFHNFVPYVFLLEIYGQFSGN